MSISLLGPREIDKMAAAGRAAAATLELVGTRIRPGITTADIDRWVREDTAARGGRPSQLGYRVRGVRDAFPAAVCTSVNEVVCHGIPSPSRVLHAGDIVNVDVTTELDGFHGDTSRTFAVGDISPDARRLLSVAERCLDVGLEQIRPGGRLGDVGAAIEEFARSQG